MTVNFKNIYTIYNNCFFNFINRIITIYTLFCTVNNFFID